MAKTATERQAKYRADRPYAGSDGNGERRLNMWLSTAASLALGRLARRYCVTKRAIIERLMIAEDARISASIDLDSPEWDKYFGIVSRYAVTMPQVLHPAAHPIPQTEKTTLDQPNSESALPTAPPFGSQGSTAPGTVDHLAEPPISRHRDRRFAVS